MRRWCWWCRHWCRGWRWFWGRRFMGFWHRTLWSRRDYNRGLLSRRFNFIMFLLLLLRLMICLKSLAMLSIGKCLNVTFPSFILLFFWTCPSCVQLLFSRLWWIWINTWLVSLANSDGVVIGRSRRSLVPLFDWRTSYLGRTCSPFPPGWNCWRRPTCCTNSGWRRLSFSWLGWWSRWWTYWFWRSLRYWDIRNKNFGFGAVSEDLRLDCTWYSCRRRCYGNWCLFLLWCVPMTWSGTLSTCCSCRQKPTNTTSRGWCFWRCLQWSAMFLRR